MKHFVTILLATLCLLCSQASFSQRIVGPKAEKKEQKMIKKQNKIEKKMYHGHHRKANKKRMRAQRKTAKLTAKVEKDK
jgi:hypothetical protein